jgi:hypothetical protein
LVFLAVVVASLRLGSGTGTWHVETFFIMQSLQDLVDGRPQEYQHQRLCCWSNNNIPSKFLYVITTAGSSIQNQQVAAVTEEVTEVGKWPSKRRWYTVVKIFLYLLLECDWGGNSSIEECNLIMWASPQRVNQSCDRITVECSSSGTNCWRWNCAFFSICYLING